MSPAGRLQTRRQACRRHPKNPIIGSPAPRPGPLTEWSRSIILGVFLDSAKISWLRTPLTGVDVLSLRGYKSNRILGGSCGHHANPSPHSRRLFFPAKKSGRALFRVAPISLLCSGCRVAPTSQDCFRRSCCSHLADFPGSECMGPDGVLMSCGKQKTLTHGRSDAWKAERLNDRAAGRLDDWRIGQLGGSRWEL